MIDRMAKAKIWWIGSDTFMHRLDVEGLLPLTCGADWNELEDWEKEVVAQHVEQINR